MVVNETDEWIVSVVPMLFNDRVMLTHRDEYPTFATAGWCYDRGPSAMLAAKAWNPDVTREPLGYKKCAFDARKP